MFEGIVSDLLNRVLGTYIENLDYSKLKISIWGGDVALNSLFIKQSALDELNLPIRPVYGYIERLILKIPWSKLYTDRWEASIEGLMLIVVPNTSIVYDPIKEEQIQHEVKLAALNRIEEAKQRSKVKNLGNKTNQDGFMEKLIAQIIRNVQVQIKNIHIRYEDSMTRPSKPFAAGAVLQNLSLHSTDSEWKLGLDTAKLIYKLLTLDGFLLYWSPNTKLLSQLGVSKEELQNVFSNITASENDSELYLKPVVGPVTLKAKLQLNTHPELDEVQYSMPKALLNVVLETLHIGVSGYQYADMMSLLDSLDRLTLSSTFRKHRPNVDTVGGNAQLWWQYAYACKLENIRRIRRNWSWQHMKEHREKCKLYKNLYKVKLSGAKLTQDQKKVLEDCERALDVFNVTLIRRQSEMEQEREGQIKAKAQQKKGWFGGWFSWGTAQQESQDESTATDIVHQFEAAMNTDEKQKLYEAIGYAKEGIPDEMPIPYVDIMLKFLLEELQVRISDEETGEETLSIATLSKVICSVHKRSAARAIKIESSIQSLEIEGLCVDQSVRPKLIESLNVSASVPLLYVMAETNPLDMKCDTRVQVQAQPLNITYHSDTITQAANLFTPPKDVSLQQLQAAALMQLEVVKERSVTGLQAAIDNHSILDLNISIAASRLILPEKGYYDPTLSMIVMTLGSISIVSKPRDEYAVNLVQLAANEKDQEIILQKTRTASYDYFNICLKDIQIVVAGNGQDWMKAITSAEATPMHLLRPLSLNTDVMRCLIFSDPNLPKIKISASLPEIALAIIDTKIVEAAVILNNCFNQDAATISYEEEETVMEDTDVNQNIVTDEIALARLENSEIITTQYFQPTPQFTELTIDFAIGAMVVDVLKSQAGASPLNLLRISAKETELQVVKRTYDLNVQLTLYQIAVEHLEWGVHHIIRTHSASDSDEVLLKLKFCQVNPKSPDIHTIHASVTHLVDLEISSVFAKLEQRALLSLLAFSTNLQNSLSELTPQTKVPNTKAEKSGRNETKSKKEKPETEKLEKSVELQKRPSPFEKKISARMGEVNLTVSRNENDLITIKIKGLSADILMRKLEMRIYSCLRGFAVYDPNPEAQHTNIIVMDGGHAWDATVKIFEESGDETRFFNVNKCDISIKVELGTPRIVFLNKIVVDVMSWIDNFQVAKDALASASQAAAQAAKSNLKEAYSQCSKVKLDLILKAPVIFVPHNSASSQGILLDLGKITIKNKFELGPTRNELGHPSVFDKLSLIVQDVKISRKHDLNDKEEIQLLMPFSLSVEIARNLSILWLQTVPEVEISARLQTAEIKISENDLSTVFTILSDNLGETPDENALSGPSIPEVEDRPERAALLSKEEKTRKLSVVGKVFKKISVQFIMDNVTLCLFVSDCQGNQSPVEQISHSDCDSFAKFSLSGLTVKLDMFSDFTISANLLLFSCVLEDTRKDFQFGITKMVEKKPAAYERNLPLFDLTFHQGIKKDIFVDLKICECLLIIHLPFLLRLQKFITIETPQEMNIEEEDDENFIQPPPLLSTQTSVKRTASIRDRQFKKKNPSIKKKLSEDEETGPESVMTIRVKIEQPDIVLMKDLTTLDAPCIFLHSEIQSNIKMSATQRNITATVNNIQMYTCYYNPDKRRETLSQILTRSEMSFICSSTADHADNIQIMIGSLNFHLAPDAVELFMNIISCLSSTEEKVTISDSESKNWEGLWNPRQIDFSLLPNLRIDAAEEADTAVMLQTPPVSPSSHELQSSTAGGERLCLELECLHITLESGSGAISIPLLKLQSECVIMAEGFYSSQLSFSGHFSIELAYYNPRQAIWEPLLEPVEKLIEDGSVQQRSWSLSFEGNMDMTPKEDHPIRMRVKSSPSPSNSTEEFIEIEQPPPAIKLNLNAKDPLNFTVTKTFLQVVTLLSDAFVEAYQGKLSVRHAAKAPFKLLNRTGLTITVGLKSSGLTVSPTGDCSVEELVVESAGEVELFEITSHSLSHRRHSSLVAECQISEEKFINIKVPDVTASCSIPVTKADKRYFSITPKGKFKEKLGLVTSVCVEGGCKVIMLSSCVKVKNELDAVVDIYYMTENGNEVEFVCSLRSQEEFLLPLRAVYTPTAELFFSVKGYSVCINPLVWKRLQNFPNLIQELHCQPRSKNGPTEQTAFMFCASCEVEQIFWGNTNRRTIDSIMMEVQLRPCIVLNNLLPVAISLIPPGTTEKKVMLPGTSLHIAHAQMGAFYLELQIFDYQRNDWQCGKTIDSAPPELSVWTFRIYAFESDVTLDLGMHITRLKGTHYMSLYCPFWMINKTGHNLTYKTDGLVHSIEHNADSKDAVLFSFRSKSFFGKKKANILLDNGEWSEKFPLDTVGSSGAVICKTKNINYQVSIDIQLSGSGLTKIVTFSAFYKAVNHCPYVLEFSYPDDPSGSWHPIASGECLGIWPPGPSTAFSVRIQNTKEKTHPIHFDAPHTTLFKLKNKFGGIFVEVTVAEGGTLISLDQCLEGATTALVLNHLRSSSLAFWQEDHEDKKIELGPEQMLHFTWDSAESRRLLVFSCMGCEPIKLALNADAKGTINDGQAAWATWLSGPHRYVIVSEDMNLLENPSKANEIERVDQELEISFTSIGFSLVNDVKATEIMYLCMASSGIVWEHRKERGKKYRPFAESQTELLEKVYLMHVAQSRAMKETVQSRYSINPNLEVDFTLMKVFKPFQRYIRRVFQPGVWLQLQLLPSQRNLHVKVNKIQLDNQMQDVMFPVVLACVPQPKGVMVETVPKSFFEMSIVMSVDSPIFAQFRYFQMLIQEFHVKVELPFIFAICDAVFPEQNLDVMYSPEKYEKDAVVIYQDLTAMVAAQRQPSRRDFYHHLHLSPIKMHLSFSLTGLDSGSNVPVGGQVIHLFLQSVGVTLTEVQDVVFRLGFFERQNCWLNLEGFQSEVIAHYWNQVMKQLYILVLGLDVLGNPFGLVLGMTKGFGDLFYEPIQGAIEGPGEFAEGLFYGARSFMGKTVGGAAGAFSRITGTIGKGVASLTLDEEYQRRRREEMHKKPADGLESFARGGKGVLTGVVDGVTGVFLKPISGAKEEGVEGFFKGVGKGMVGLVTRPASGVIDFASGSFDAVMRATDSSEEIVPVRPSRFIALDGIIRPYDYRSSAGAKMLREIEKGRYTDTDVYVVHALARGGKTVLLGSDKRVFLVSKNDLLGQWKVEWVHSYDELTEAPLLVSSLLKLTVRAVKKKVLGVFGGGDNSKEIALYDEKENKFVLDRLQEAYNKYQQTH